jgi:hypothetical protein
MRRAHAVVRSPEICLKSALSFAPAWLYLIDSMERETGIEPATFSLGSRFE